MQDKDFKDVKVIRLMDESIITPSRDGSSHNKMYGIPLLLSESPPAEWQKILRKHCNHSESPVPLDSIGDMSISNNRALLIVESTDNLKAFCEKTLNPAVKKANEEYRDILLKRSASKEQWMSPQEEDIHRVKEIIKSVKFE